MTAIDAPLEATARPWPGLDAFSEALRDFFFGRATETEELFRRVRGETLTLLFGQFGLGKTSLLRAGLASRLRAAAFLPVYVRLDYAEGAPTPLAQVKAAVERAAAAAHAEVMPIEAEETLWGYFHRADRRVTSNAGELLVPALIFDQFEEVFTLGLAREASRATAQRFLAELAELIENRPPDSVEKAIESDPEAIEKYQFDRQEYRIVVALREDYLPQLDSMRERAPLIVRNRFRLRRMTGRQGFDAVTRPVPGLIAPELAWEITRIAARENPEDAFGPAPGEGARNLAKLAEYQLRANQLEEARANLGEAEHLAETTEEKDHLAEIIRLRGRLWHAEGHHKQARICFERAIERSREQGARLFELCAAHDLARLSTETGDGSEALQTLRSIVDWFPSTLDVPILAESRALLR
jgi:tetratricopeptide (TPR) repeat protein